MLEVLRDLLLASDLGLDLQLEATAHVAIDCLPRLAIAKEVLYLLPLLALDIEFVLDGVRVHDVRQHGKLLVIVQIFQRVGQDLAIPIYHQDVYVLVPLVGLVFGSIPEQNGHPAPLILQILEANQAKI